MGVGSIFKTIGKFSPFIGPAITGFEVGRSIAGAVKGRGGGGRGGGSTDPTEQNDLLRQQGEIAGTTKGFSERLLPQAEANIGAASNYYLPLVSGNQQEVMSSLAPDISAVNTTYDQALEDTGRFAPRGGGAAQLQSEARTGRAKTIADLVSRRRSEAAGAVGQLGLGAGQLGVGAGDVASRATSRNQEIVFGKRQQNLQMIGEGARVGGALLADLILRRKKKGGSKPAKSPTQAQPMGVGT